MALDPRREGRLTASNFGAAMGINPYMSRQKLFRTNKGLEPKFTGNEMTEWGNKHEMTAVNAYEADQGVIVTKCGDDQEFVIDDVNDWTGCTPDGFTIDSKIVEVKCPWSKMYTDIPAYYMAQMQGQMAITETKECDFVVWYMADKEETDLSKAELAVWRVKYSEDYYKAMLVLLEDFWHSVQEGVEPKRRKKPVMPTVEYELLF
jgi:putative phage-type endonuclease